MRSLFIILCLLFIFVSQAQIRDAKAKTILEEVSARANAAKSIRADFSYLMDNPKAKIHEEKKGKVLISGDKYTMTAAGQTVISDGTTIWTYFRESNEVQVNAVDEDDEALTPTRLLTSYHQNYNAKSIKSEDPAWETIELTPVKTKNFSKAILNIHKTKKQITSFRIYDKNGNVFTYKISNYTTDVPVTTAEFTFDPKKYPGVEIIDMR